MAIQAIPLPSAIQLRGWDNHDQQQTPGISIRPGFVAELLPRRVRFP